MKVCIAGVGAIGGMIGYRLAQAGCEVSGLARGTTLKALREKGLRYSEVPAGEEKETGDAAHTTGHACTADKARITNPAHITEVAPTPAVAGAAGIENIAGTVGPVGVAHIRASDVAGELGPQDLVVIAVKGPSLASLVPLLTPLLGPDTIVLPAMNGVPWWFFQGFGGALEGSSLKSIDPRGLVAAAIPPKSIIGCVVHCGASCPEPGMVRVLPKKKLIIGEPSGMNGSRARELAALLTKAGFDAPVSDCIQRDIWYKLWGNMTMNPISALTGATMDRILADPLLAEFCRSIMEEARRVGAKIGCAIDQSVDDRFAITRFLGAFKTSMLQDLEARRPMELDALVSAPVEIAALVGEPTPNMNILLGLARLQARILSLYPEKK